MLLLLLLEELCEMTYLYYLKPLNFFRLLFLLSVSMLDGCEFHESWHTDWASSLNLRHLCQSFWLFHRLYFFTLTVTSGHYGSTPGWTPEIKFLMEFIVNFICKRLSNECYKIFILVLEVCRQSNSSAKCCTSNHIECLSVTFLYQNFSFDWSLIIRPNPHFNVWNHITKGINLVV